MLPKRIYDQITGIDFKPDVNSSALQLGVRKITSGLEVAVCIKSFDDDGGYLEGAKNREDYDFYDMPFTSLKEYFEKALVGAKIPSIGDVRAPSSTAFIWRFELDKKEGVYGLAKGLEEMYAKK